MRIAVFSDTHSNTGGMVRAVREEKPDAIIHLGDCIRDTRILQREFPDIPLYAVCGNCDYGEQEAETDVVELGPVSAFITHGHLYNVRWGVDSLVYAAQEQECQLALYGHTHEADSRHGRRGTGADLGPDHRVRKRRHRRGDPGHMKAQPPRSVMLRGVCGMKK